PEVQRGWVARPLHPERVAGQGQGSQLATSPQGRVHLDDAVVLAQGKGPVNHRRFMEGPGGAGGPLIPGSHAMPGNQDGRWPLFVPQGLAIFTSVPAEISLA